MAKLMVNNPTGNEEELTALLDGLDEAETDALLAHLPQLRTRYDSTRHVRADVLQRAGFSGHRLGLRRPAVVLIMAALLIVTLGIIGVDKVAAAIGGLFGFVPGYGIVQNDSSIQYTAAELSSTSNEQAQLTLRSVLATTDSISVSYELRPLDYQNQRSREIYLHLGQLRYIPSGSSLVRGGSGNGEKGYFTFLLLPKQIDTETTYRLELAQYEISVEFTLKAVDSYDDLTQIGATQTHNDISLTAVPHFTEDGVTVELYPLNNSKYQLESYYAGSEYVYQGQYLHLETSNGIRECQPQNFGTVLVGRYNFELTERDNDLVLKLPYLLVRTEEAQNISLPIPQEGQRVVLNKKVRFADSTLIIEEIEKKPAEYGEGYEFCMSVRMENRQPNLVLRSVRMERIRILGDGGYSYGYDVDDDGIMYEVRYTLEENDGNSLRLKLSQPAYYLLGEYSLPLEHAH